jgi:lipid-binding SYLF domain-containing protein
MTALRSSLGWPTAGGLVAVTLMMVGCATPRGKTVMEKRQFVNDMHDKTMARLETNNPELARRVHSAPGYGVFNTANVHLLLLATGHGYGLVKNNRTGEETYMRMTKVGVGVGAGLKDIEAVFLFNTETALRNFVDRGWEIGAGAEAAATSGGKGAAAAAGASTSTAGAQAGVAGKAGGESQAGTGDSIEIYQMTKAGVALEATLAGTKYWRDAKLNE